MKTNVKLKIREALQCCMLEFSIKDGDIIIKDKNTQALFLWLVDNKSLIKEKFAALEQEQTPSESKASDYALPETKTYPPTEQKPAGIADLKDKLIEAMKERNDFEKENKSLKQQIEFLKNDVMVTAKTNFIHLETISKQQQQIEKLEELLELYRKKRMNDGGGNGRVWDAHEHRIADEAIEIAEQALKDGK